MNKRIKELVEQAGIKMKYRPEYSGLDTAIVNFMDLEDFAELIVKECCDQVRMVDAMEIKRHFGVEE
jgi:hypothetical protein